MAKPHLFTAQVKWQGNIQSFSFNHDLEFPNKPPLFTSAAPEFKGDPKAYNPEEMLVGALSSCHMMSFLYLCMMAKIQVTHYVDHAQGEMELSGGVGKFSKVTLNPVVTLADPSQESKLVALHEKAHHMCFISNSVNFPVEVKGSTTY